MHSVRGQPCLPPAVSVRVCSDMALDASCTPSPGPSPRTGQNTDIITALFQEEKYELASNRKICHLELSFSSVGWPVLVNAVGQQFSISPVFLSGELSPFGNFFQDACENWNCNNMKIKSSCPCPALLLTGKPHWLFQSFFFFYFKVLSWLPPMRKCMVILLLRDFLVLSNVYEFPRWKMWNLIHWYHLLFWHPPPDFCWLYFLMTGSYFGYFYNFK